MKLETEEKLMELVAKKVPYDTVWMWHWIQDIKDLLLKPEIIIDAVQEDKL